MFLKNISFLLLLQVNYLFTQQIVSFNINLPEILTADAGCDHYLNTGQTAILGGNPTAIGGTSPFYYYWSPGAFLNDSTISNPAATPQHTVSYTLSIIDKNNCSSSDVVNVYVPLVNVEKHIIKDVNLYYVLKFRTCKNLKKP